MILLTFFYFLGRYIIPLKSQFLFIGESLNSISSIINLVFIPIILFQLKRIQFSIIYLCVCYAFYIFYAGPQTLSFSVIFTLLVSVQIAQKLQNEKSLYIIIYSGLAYCLLLYILLFEISNITNLLELRRLNYITGVIFIFTITCLFYDKNIYALVGIVFLLFLKSRTSLLSVIILLFLKYYKNIYFYITGVVFSLFFQYFIGFENIIYKWGKENGASSDRVDNWIAYINIIFEKFPSSLMPYWFIDLKKDVLMIYDINIVNKASSPHNLFIDLILHQGIILGILNIILFCLPVFITDNKIRCVYISLLVFGFFEPSLTYGTSIISIVFFIFNYIGLKKLKVFHE
jgi:hypothetical protein